MTTTNKVRGFRAIILSMAAMAQAAFGQAYPAKTITLNSSLTAGSNYEAILRIMAEDIQKRTGKTCDCARDDKRNQFVLISGKADGLHACFIFANCFERTPEARAQSAINKIRHQYQQA